MRKDHGNVLFIILIAVALFAALASAVKQSSLSSGNIDKERLGLDASAYIDAGQKVTQAVQRLKNFGCSNEDISFHHANWGHDDYKHTPESSDGCKVFHPSGGGALFPPQLSDEAGLPWEFDGRINVAGLGASTATSEDMDLVMYLPGVSLEVCNTLNDQLDLGFSSPPVDKDDLYEGVSSPRFDGVYSNTSSDALTGSTTTGSACPNASLKLCYKWSGCFKEETGNEYYIFYNALIQRSE